MLKNYFIFSLLFITSVSGQEITKTKQKGIDSTQIKSLNEELFITKYKQSLEFFKEKKYEKSYLLLEELFNIKANDININFYLGRSAYEIKKYDEAISAYERFLFEKPNNYRVKLEMARSLFMTKSFKEAKKLFLEVKKDPKIPKASLVIIEYYLQLIDKSISKHFFNGVVMLGVIYDSNIGNQDESSLREFFKEFLGSTYDPNADIQVNDDSAWYNQEIAILNYKYKLNNSTEIKQDFLIFNKDSFDSAHDDTKVTLLSYTPGLSIKHNPKLTINYALYTDFLKYGGEDKLKTIALYPQFNYLYNKTNTITGYLKYQKKSDQQDNTKDSKYKEASASLKRVYNKTLSSTSNIIISNEKAKDGKQTSIDFTSIKGSFSLNFKYKPTLFFTPSLSYTITKYDDIDSSYLKKPENKQFKIALSTTYVYSPKWILQGSTDFTTQNSNIAPNEYDKYTFGINLIRPF